LKHSKRKVVVHLPPKTGDKPPRYNYFDKHSLTNMPNNFQAWQHSSEEVLAKLQTSLNGLTATQVRNRLSQYGRNEMDLETRRSWLHILIFQFKNPLALILLAASLLSGFLGEITETVIIVVMVLLSSLLGFIQEYKSEQALASLRKKVAHKTAVLRHGETLEIDSREIVPGDIVLLSIGDIVPADLRLLETHDLLVNETLLTGESFPVEKQTLPVNVEHEVVQDIKNMVFMGTHVIGGSCKGIVVATGKSTIIGKTAKYLKTPEEATEFQKGIKNFGSFIVRIILAMVLFIFIVNALFRREFLESLLFALALAVGITPELLPVIITINLSRGAKKMAEKKVIVKRLMSIEDLGNADILCTDKTGTLTEGKIFLSDYFDFDERHDDQILLYSLLCNSAVVNQEIAGSPLDAASWIYAREKNFNLTEFKKYKRLDELIFDFKRRRMSVVVLKNNKRLMVSKGAAESILAICDQVLINGQKKAIKTYQKKIAQKFEDLSGQGFRVLAVAQKEVGVKQDYKFDDEHSLTLVGFLTFIDKPKKTAKTALQTLNRLGIAIKILTGDNQFVTQHICKELGFEISKIVTGEQVEKLNDDKLAKIVNGANVFVKITPEDKLRIIKTLRANQHTVAFLGDGINDAPALKAADVGISVDTAVDVAREAADIILLKKSLGVLADGVLSGRETFGNSIKYIFNTTSANYGNMISIAGASLFLPFLPLLPSQILLNNFLSDVPNLSISTDQVDPEYLKKPKHWNIKAIGRFMTFFGLISSIFDFLTFALLLFITRANIGLFRTGWFIESALSEIIVVFAIRTRRTFFKSRPSKILITVSIVTAVFTVFMTYTDFGKRFFEFMPLPLPMLGIIFLILIAYFTLAEISKRYYYKKFEI